MARNDWHYISILIIFPLLIGLIVFRDYGVSTDEGHLHTYSDYSLHAYQDIFNLNPNLDLGKGNFRYYGPSFLMGANIFTRLVVKLFSNLPRSDVWHLAYFLSFQSCVIGLYFLAKRWFSSWVSFSTSLLFLFQPLIWGHAFINPKDIPFMSFCLLSVLSGLAMQEKLFPIAEKWELPKIPFLKEAWYRSDTANRNKIIYLSILIIAILAILTFGKNWIEKISLSFLNLISLLGSENLITKLFSLIAGSNLQTPVLSYLPKVVKFIDLALLVFATLLLFRIFSLLWMIFVNHPFRLNHVSLSKLIRDILSYLSNPLVIAAGAVLGLTISVRILGPFFGLIVLMVALYRAKFKVVPAFVSYFLIAFSAMYLTWPYLWGSPISHFKTSLIYMIDFPWNGKVLFNGSYYPSNQLPIGYVPVLFGIQFTEPVIFLFVIGLYLFSYQVWNRSIKIDFAITTLFWGIFPFVAFTILRPSLYDNTRQLLFIVPPLFLILGLVLEKLFQLSRNAYINISILALLLLPGIYQIIHLHPYEYTYYNSFVQNIYKRFETDYWATSFRDAMEYLNKIAPGNSKVIVYGPGDTDNVSEFARPDLAVDSMINARYDISNDYQYVIVSTRNDRDSKNFTDWITLYTIRRDSTIFALVKQKP